jgi:uncharacterized protein (AIM24 family)
MDSYRAVPTGDFTFGLPSNSSLLQKPMKTFPLFFNSRGVLARAVVALLLVGTGLSGCKKPEVEPPAPTTLSADAGPDQQVPVGQAVLLDGSASKDSEGKSFTYQWALTRRPAKSTATLQAPTNVKPTFTPDELGEYEVELTIANAAGKSSDRMVVTAGVAQPIAITDDIKVKTVLLDRFANPELPDYIVTKSLFVSAELTVNPGVVIAFERDARLDINSDGGILIARGTAEKKIRFVGAEKTKGFWAGLVIFSTSSANTLEHAELRHAGSRVLINNTKTALALGSAKGQVSLKNSLFAQNDGYGLYALSGSVIREFETNTFRENTQAPILLSADNVARLDAASIFTGSNGRNAVEIMRSAIEGTTEVVWTGFTDKTPYRVVESELNVNAGWKLSPGVTIELARDAVIRVNSNGYLNAQGTADKKISFTGTQAQASHWKGMIVYSASGQNLIEHAELRNAGSGVVVSGKRSALAVYGTNARTTVKNTKISGSGGYGIYVGAGGSVNADATTVNTFEGNAQASLLRE